MGCKLRPDVMNRVAGRLDGCSGPKKRVLLIPVSNALASRAPRRRPVKALKTHALSQDPWNIDVRARARPAR